MPRILSTLLVLGLLGGTAAAFAVTERLKLVPSPIIAPVVTEAFSPACDCPTDHATIVFRLRDRDRLTVTIVDADGDPVQSLVEGESFPAGTVAFDWNGRSAADGVYRARVHLAEARRTIEIPNEVRLDTTPPELDVESVAPTAVSPDGDGRSDFVRVRFRLSELGRLVLLVDGDEVLTSSDRREGKVEWYARGFRPGLYELEIRGQDVAGNRSEPVRETVRLRFLELAPRRVLVPAGVRFGVRVATDAQRYRWQLGARRGSSGAQSLVLRAPVRPGRYTLTVVYRDHRDAIPIFVRPRP